MVMAFFAAQAEARWNPDWPIRKKKTIDAGAGLPGVNDPIGPAVVLLRLHEGNYQFALAKEDGSDLRIVAEDDKTLLPYHIERFDPLLNEAFVWVRVPEIKAGGSQTFWLYYGNTGDKAVSVNDPKGTYEVETALVYHFSDRSGPPADVTKNGNSAQNAGLPVEGALIAGGLRLGGLAITIPASDSLAWKEGGALTWSAWIKPAALRENGILFSRREGDRSLIIGENNGIPFVEINGQRSTGNAPLALNAWRHLAVIADGAKITLFLDGESYATLNSPLPSFNGPSLLGKDSAGEGGFSGEIDELQIVNTARSIGALKLAAISQSGSAQAAKLIVIGTDEGAGGGGHSEMLAHVMLFGDIAKNMMFDGWIAVGVCVLMIFFGWTVAIRKFNYLNSIQQGSDAFLKQWAHVSSDLTALDHDDEESVRNMGGNVDRKTLRNMHRSPLFHLYHIGSEEIRLRIGNGKDRALGLSSRSIQAIRASLESGLVRENQRMNKGLIFLTISIAGGPYVGLLGTVVGVMITFAIIAKSGEVDVNSIAPGIASALLATVAGLIVAIPALFIYSYLSSRIKDLLAAMQVFIDEFIAKMAEFYPTPGDLAAAGHGIREAVPPPRSAIPETATASGANHHHAS